MVKQSSLLFSLLATSLFVCSCTSNVKVFSGNLDEARTGKIVTAVHPSVIGGIIVDSTNLLTFTDSTGVFDIKEGLIKGTDSNGVHVEHRLKDLIFVKFLNTDIAPTYMRPTDLMKLFSNLSIKPDQTIKRGSIPYWDVVRFARDGAQINIDSSLLTGRTKQGTEVTIKISELRYLEVNRRNSFKTIRTGLAIIYVALIANSIWDWSDLTED